jgi:hypothetical protein
MRLVSLIWRRFGPGSQRGSAFWWGFQCLALLFLIILLSMDGKWWMCIFIPFVLLAGYHTIEAIKRRQFF